MHHGLYPNGTRRGIDRIEAQEALIDRLLEFGGVDNAQDVLDVGCGIGGSSRYLVPKLGATVLGITLSPFQARRAAELATTANVTPQTRFIVADAQRMPIEDNRYDVVWSMESAEHFPDKQAFIAEAQRVLKPGGKLLLATWICHQRPLVKFMDRCLLAMINRAYALPPWAISEDYRSMCENAGLVDIRQGDWSEHVKPFWTEVLRQTVSIRGICGLMRVGPTVIRGAAVVPLMIAGFERGTIRYMTLVATKP